jgi:hypothetical protein
VDKTLTQPKNKLISEFIKMTPKNIDQNIAQQTKTFSQSYPKKKSLNKKNKSRIFGIFPLSKRGNCSE